MPFGHKRARWVEALIRELTKAYSQAGLDCGTGLLPPAADADVDWAAGEIGQPVHDDLRAVWRVHGGQPYFGVGVSGLFGRHRLLSPGEAVAEYQLIWECEFETPPPGAAPRLCHRPVLELVPFASWDANTLCVHAASGEVWELDRGLMIRRRPGIDAVLSEILAAVRTGAAEPGLSASLGWGVAEPGAAPDPARDNGSRTS
jgi:hypothetical protein